VTTDPEDPSVDPRILTEATLTYSVVRGAMAAWYGPYFRPRIEARANVPATGGVLMVSNHQSFLDIPLVAIACSRHVSFVARDSLARSRVLAHVMRECGAVLVRRGRADHAAMREMIEHLRQGDCVCIFPEGTRTSDGRLQPVRGGALLAARKAGVPILPLGIRGTFDAWARRHRVPRPRRIGLRFGKPVDSADPEALKRVRFQIQAMIGDGHFRSVAPL
jgi:1-acyl-sn-glycerol-3-phosphate acyltransferase